MDSYMAASDILLGKAGGLTSSEAFARGLVLIVVNPVPGQEERNSDHFLEEGVAIRCNNLPALSFKIDALLGDKERFQKMQQSAKKFGRPNAALEIASILLK
jgi:processive 1,2-diacylglycerol beta-glucosyltransferase